MSSIAEIAARDLEAAVVYLTPMAEKPIAYNYDPPPGEPQRTGEYLPHKVTIRDARPIAGQFLLDRQGFTLVSRPSAVKDFHDEAVLRAVYYPEIERLVKEVT